jgi:putative transposase
VHRGIPFEIVGIDVSDQRTAWRSFEEVEFATLEWVDWFNNRRLFEPIGNLPPADFEAPYDERLEAATMEVGLT